jgi:putative ABC transport system permease protein
VSRVFASGGYFDLLGLTLLEGRVFSENDRLDGPRVVVLTRSAAERHWPGESPVGKVIRIGTPDSSPMEVVGVVSDLRQYGIRYRPYPTAFISLAQAAPNEFTVMLQTPEGPERALEALRRVVGELDPGLPLYQIRTLDEVVGANVAEPRFAMFLAVVFGVVALILAAVGIYGVLAYAVAQRTHEIGIRLALGAERQQVVRLVLRQGLVLAGGSLALGVPMALALTRLMGSFLFEVGPSDPPTFGVVTLAVVAVALVACVVPATRAAGMDPVGAIRRK